jgi:hypothetical protein
VLILPAVSTNAPAAEPVRLWLSGALGTNASAVRSTDIDHEQTTHGAPPSEEAERRAYRAQREDMPKEKNGLAIMFRAESLLAVAEFLRINRPTDDDPDPNAAAAARDLDHLSLAQDKDPVASKVKFDLDLPSAAEDDIVLGPGLRLPEWDYRKQRLLEDHVCLTELVARNPACAARHAGCTSSLPRCSRAACGSSIAPTAPNSMSMQWCARRPTAASAATPPNNSTCRSRSVRATCPVWSWPICRYRPTPGFRLMPG